MRSTESAGNCERHNIPAFTGDDGSVRHAATGDRCGRDAYVSLQFLRDNPNLERDARVAARRAADARRAGRALDALLTHEGQVVWRDGFDVGYAAGYRQSELHHNGDYGVTPVDQDAEDLAAMSRGYAREARRQRYSVGSDPLTGVPLCKHGDDQPKVNLCECLKFKLWYNENSIDVCECGHPRIEHLDSSRSCTGEVEIIPAQHKPDYGVSVRGPGCECPITADTHVPSCPRYGWVAGS